MGTPAAEGVRIVAGFLVIWIVLDQSAALFNSYRGEAGILVCVIVLLVALGVERVLFGAGPREALRSLGLRRPEARGMVAAILL